MYAVIETGGKQYRVEVGTELEVELLDGEPGDSITIDRVLLVVDGDDSAIGHPVVADAGVEAEVVRRDRTDKVISFKYRPKARRRVKKGHRQDVTVLRITEVKLGKRSAADDRRKAEAAREVRAGAPPGGRREAGRRGRRPRREARQGICRQGPGHEGPGEGRSEGPGSRRQVREGRQARRESRGQARREGRHEDPARQDPVAARPTPSRASAKPKAPRTTKKDE